MGHAQACVQGASSVRLWDGQVTPYTKTVYLVMINDRPLAALHTLTEARAWGDANALPAYRIVPTRLVDAGWPS